MSLLHKTYSTSPVPSVHLFTRDEYRQMARSLLFEDRRVELLEGQVIDMSPMGTRHSVGVVLAGDVLRAAFGPGFHVRTQMSLGLSPISEPEPDVAVVAGSPRDYLAEHPATALLVVEVAETSIEYDRRQKAAAYAKAGITDYWILNVADGQLEIHRNPTSLSGSGGNFAYAVVEIVGPDRTVSPLGAPTAQIAVRDLLPISQ